MRGRFMKRLALEEGGREAQGLGDPIKRFGAGLEIAALIPTDRAHIHPDRFGQTRLVKAAPFTRHPKA